MRVPNLIHHVFARGVNKQQIFFAEEDYRFFLWVTKQALQENSVRCLAYCLMPNHYHLLIQHRDPVVPLLMKKINETYARYINKKHERVGHLFQGRYGDVIVEPGGHALQLCRYIELNPVRANLCSDPGSYLWSSARAKLGRAPAPSFLDVFESYRLLGLSEALPLNEKRRAYARYLSQLDQARRYKEILASSIRHGFILGSDDFVEKVLQATEHPYSFLGSRF
jgi:putative transposase